MRALDRCLQERYWSRGAHLIKEVQCDSPKAMHEEDPVKVTGSKKKQNVLVGNSRV